MQYTGGLLLWRGFWAINVRVYTRVYYYHACKFISTWVYPNSLARDPLANFRSRDASPVRESPPHIETQGENYHACKLIYTCDNNIHACEPSRLWLKIRAIYFVPDPPCRVSSVNGNLPHYCLLLSHLHPSIYQLVFLPTTVQRIRRITQYL